MAYLGRLFFVALFASAGAFLVWATRKAIQHRRLWLDDGLVVDGEVVGFVERYRIGTTSGRTPVAPTVSFRAPGSDGEIRRFTSREANYPNPFVLGQQVRVRYLARDPREVELDSVTRSWLFIVAIGVLALACLACALVPIVVTVLELRR
jgi:hypothetical protein